MIPLKQIEEVVARELLEHWVHVSSGRCACGETLPLDRDSKRVLPDRISEHVARKITDRLDVECMLVGGDR